MRNAARLSRSVGAKLFVLVLLVLLSSFGVLGFLNVRLHRRHLEAARLTAAMRMADVVRRSTSHYMLRNDRAALRHIVDTIGQQPGITRVRISDSRGNVAFSAGVAPPTGTRELATSTPISNTATCATAACHAHPASQKTLGVLELNYSLAEADAEIRSASWQFTAQSAAAIVLTLLVTAIFVWRFVHKPVRALRDGTERLGRGELGVQIPVESRDELGALARSFNTMSVQLHDAREEITTWTRTLEERVRSKTAELQRAHQQMIQAEKLTSLGKLAAVVAHEINNPLSGILTYAKLLRKWIERGDDLQSRSADMRDSLQLIESESRRCGDIVRNLLTFARVQPLNISDVDINRIVTQCVKLVEHKLELGNIVPHLELGSGLPSIRGDGGQIEQLLLALIMNAIEAMPREGNLHVVTDTSRRSAEVMASAPLPPTADRRPPTPDEAIVIRIEDDGMGIPPDILPRLFEPFMTTKEEGKGVGLGLAISRAIVDRHGGRIDVSSEVGRGTTFTITLPTSHLAASVTEQQMHMEVA
jgi:two-component system NtrC family sensor kinase